MRRFETLTADLKRLKHFFAYFKPHWKYVVFAVFFLLISVLLQLPLPLLTRYIIDTVLPGQDISALLWIVLALVGAMIINGTSEILQGYFLTIFKVKVLFNVQLKLFQHVQTLGLSFFNNAQSGYLASRVTNDVTSLEGLLGNTLLSFCKDVLTFVVGAIVIFFFHWKLALLSLAILPFFVITIKYFSKRIRKISRESQEKISHVYGTVHEGFSSIYITKLFQLENLNAGVVVNRLKHYFKINIRLHILNRLSAFSTAFIGGLGPLLILWYGGSEVIRGNLTLGTLIAFNAFLAYLYNPAKRLVNLNVSLQSSLASLDRISELFETFPEIFEPENPVTLDDIRGTVEIKNLSFSYNGRNTVLEDINLIAHSGKTTALVGKSGAGKTTLANLLARFYDPRNGMITVDGTDIRKLSLANLRRLIGVVPQETFLFNTTIKKNIRCGRLNATDEEIIAAARMANAHDFIQELPEKYETVVGERGARLSGGQRQRLSIARAILKNPRILILDEATSDLDSESERLVQEAVARLLENRTTIVIAHRFSTILNADGIVVLDNGKVLDYGTHRELFERCDYYKNLCLNQYIKKDSASHQRQRES